MSERKSILGSGAFRIGLDEIKRRRGAPPWGEPVVLTDQMTGTVICQAPGTPNDRHYHLYDEWWVVLEGEIQWEIEGQTDPVRTKAGDFVFVPRGHYHLISVKGDRPAIRLAVSVTGEVHRHDKPG